MKIGTLIDILSNYDEDMEIVLQGCNTQYCDSIEDVVEGLGIKSFWGHDREALVIRGGSQLGSVWEVEELGLEN